MFKNIKTIFGCIGIILIVLIIICFSISTITGAPENAKVYIDIDNNVFHAPQDVSDIQEEIFIESTYENAKSLGYKIDEECKNNGYFTQENGNLISVLLKKVGIIKQNNRWNEDGTWNY